MGSHEESSSSSSTHSDDALKLFASAPWWIYCTSWKLAKPENIGSDTSTFKTTGPVCSDEMMQLYRSKRLKGSVLMAGLTQAAKDQRQSQEVPASAYRTLAHLIEMSRNGVLYTPVDCDGLKNGMPAASWSRPLWTICEPCLPAESATRIDVKHALDNEKLCDQPSTAQDVAAHESCDHSRSQAGSQHESDRSPAEIESYLAVQLLKSAPMWCYLYSHEPLKSKKTPPKSNTHMVDMYRSGCLPDWTPLLGLQTEVAHFNSLPPSLFTTLGALLTVLQAGLELQPVGPVELQRYDKFIEQRNHVGNTMRTPSTDSLRSPSSSGMSFGRRSTLTAARSSPSTDGLAHALSNLRPISSKTHPNSATTPLSCTSSTTSAHTNATTTGNRYAPSPSPVAWTNSSVGVGGGNNSVTTTTVSESPVAQTAAPAVAASPYAEGGGLLPTMMPTFGVSVPTAMPMYSPMMPFMWGMPHVPYTLLQSPTAAPAPSATAGLTSPTTPSASRRGSKRSGAGGGRVGPAPASNGSDNAASPTPARLGSAAPLSPVATASVSPMLMSPTGMTAGSPHPLLVPMMPTDPATAAAAAMHCMWPWGAPALSATPAAATTTGAYSGALGAASSGTSWTTGVFKLFMADAGRGGEHPVWWYFDPRVGASGVLVGPVGAEAMILAYASGSLTPFHCVCGTHSDVTTACPPARDFFQDLGTLLKQIESGGQYILVSLAEVNEHARRTSHNGGGGGGGATRTGSGSRGRRQRTYAGGASASSGSSAPVPPRTPTTVCSPRKDIPSSSGEMMAPTSSGERWEIRSHSASSQAGCPTSSTAQSVKGDVPQHDSCDTPDLISTGGPHVSVFELKQGVAAAVASLLDDNNVENAEAAAETEVYAPVLSLSLPAQSSGTAGLCPVPTAAVSPLVSPFMVPTSSAAVVAASTTHDISTQISSSESTRMLCYNLTKDQSRTSSRGGATTVALKNSTDDETGKLPNGLTYIGNGKRSVNCNGNGIAVGSLSDSDEDDVYGRAARDAASGAADAATVAEAQAAAAVAVAAAAAAMMPA